MLHRFINGLAYGFTPGHIDGGVVFNKMGCVLFHDEAMATCFACKKRIFIEQNKRLDGRRGRHLEDEQGSLFFFSFGGGEGWISIVNPGKVGEQSNFFPRERSCSLNL